MRHTLKNITLSKQEDKTFNIAFQLFRQKSNYPDKTPYTPSQLCMCLHKLQLSNTFYPKCNILPLWMNE